MRTFISLFVLNILNFGNAQDTTYIDVDSSFFQSSKNKKELVLNKPLSEKMIYVLRFTDIPEPDFKQRGMLYKVELGYLNRNYATDYDASKAKAQLLKNSNNSSGENNLLKIVFEVPETRFKIDDEVVFLQFGSKYDYKYTLILNLKIRVTYEQPDFYSVKQWENGKNADTEVLNVIEEKDHHAIYTIRAEKSDPEIHKVRILPNESLQIGLGSSGNLERIELMNIPYKIRYYREIGATSAFNLNNLGFGFVLTQNEWLEYSSNRRVAHKSLGASMFILPSLERVYLIDVGSVQKVDPFRATFLAFGVSLNYCINGISFHFIPFALDIQMSAETNFVAAHSHNVFMGFGIGYRPFKARY